MIAPIVVALLLHADPAPAAPPQLSYAPFNTGKVKVAMPVGWAHRENNGTHHFISPDAKLTVDLDSGTVQSAGMRADDCRDKITKALRGRFTNVPVAGTAAAKKEESVFDKKKRVFVIETWVGCDGKTTWSLVFNSPREKRATYAPVIEKIANSVEFVGEK